MTSVISSAVLRSQSDERLIALSRSGHQRAFEAIAERYRVELTRSVHRFLPSSAVEDVLQQTHLEAWKALSGGQEVRELRAWLHRIARNAAIAVASRGYDYDELRGALQVAPGPEEELERREAVRRALRGVADLPERQRDALLAVAVGGCSHAEVASDLGITDTAARQLVRRARVSLRALATVMTPPQVVFWAVRAGHHGMAAGGHTLAAGKAGAGLGGGLASPALKVGAVAIAVGGVAAGVGPIRQGLAPTSPTPTPHHHRHHARAARPPVRLASALRPAAKAHRVTSTAGARQGPASAKRHASHHVRLIAANPVGKTAPAAPSGTPAPASTAPAPAAIGAAAAAPPTGVAGLIAWALANASQQATAASTAALAAWSSAAAAGQAGSTGQSGASSPCTATASATQGSGGAAAGSASTGCATTAAFPWSYASQFLTSQAQSGGN
jgi:RNA polymerase sigma factor (sigma-70 family)